MSAVLRRSFAAFCRQTRIALDITQQELADAVGVSRGYVAIVEGGRANPSLAMVERFGDALGVDLRLVGQPPIIVGGHGQHDLVHAWCSGYADRRLRRASLSVAREVELVHGRSHGWIDLLAFDPRTRKLYVVEIKTRLDDLGAIETAARLVRAGGGARRTTRLGATARERLAAIPRERGGGDRRPGESTHSRQRLSGASA